MLIWAGRKIVTRMLWPSDGSLFPVLPKERQVGGLGQTAIVDPSVTDEVSQRPGSQPPPGCCSARGNAGLGRGNKAGKRNE